MRASAALLLLAFLAMCPQMRYPFWRGTEARRAQIAAEMVETGDYLLPRIWGQVTLAKPPLDYWSLVPPFRLFGTERGWLRLPAVLAFWLLAVFAFFHLKRRHDGTAAWLGATAILLAPVVVHDVPSAEIDPLFAALTVASIVLTVDGAARGRAMPLAAGGLLGGFALLAKGPPYFLFLAVPLVLWWRRRRLAGMTFFLPALLLPPAAYCVLLAAALQGDDLWAVVGRESLGRLACFGWGDVLEIPEFLCRALAMTLPIGLWWRGRGNDLLWAAAGAVLILLVFPGRPTRYLLPVVPLVAVGLAPVVARAFREDGPPPRWMGYLLCSMGLCGSVGLLAAPWLPHPYPGATPVVALAMALAPVCVRSQRRTILYLWVLPLLAAWFALGDRTAYFRSAPGEVRTPAAVLCREIAAWGVDPVTVEGVVDTKLLVESRLPVVINTGGWPPRQPWVLVEDRGHLPILWTVPGYRARIRVQVGKGSVALMERVQPR